MNLNVVDWVGEWENFELWIDSEEPEVAAAWTEVEAALAAMPPQVAAMFGGDPRAFWRAACATATASSPRLGGWRVGAAGEELRFEWLADDGSSLGEASYALDRAVEKGLEGKPNLLLRAVDAPEDWPFAWLLLMEPMPARTAREEGGLLAHTHFQFAADSAQLVAADGTLANPRWYATMCDAARTPSERVRVIRALHRLGPR